MSLTFAPGTARHRAASVLADVASLPFPDVCACVLRLHESSTHGEVVAALRGLKSADLAQQDKETKRWSLSEAGRALWVAQLKQERAQAEAQAIPVFKPDPALLVRNVSRSAVVPSPADRLPFTPRAGAMDFAAHPRISGPWRIWPCGRRERIDQPQNP